MKLKTFSSIIMAASLTGVFGQTGLAQTAERATVWKIVDNSLTELLDNDWKILSHGSTRSVARTYQENNDADTTLLTYILTKNGKYITCAIYDPRSNGASSRCFFMN
jgi:hypothetical protein